MLHCHLNVTSNLDHLHQVFTGFSLLAGRKIITLSQAVSSASAKTQSDVPHLRYAHLYRLEVILNQGTRLVYDVHDSFEIDDQALSKADYYFKRSYDPFYVREHPEGHKVFSLGLNYLVEADYPDYHALARARLSEAKGRALLTALALTQLIPSKLWFVPHLRHSADLPRFDQQAKALFMVRTWDPATAPSAEKAAEFAQLNEDRANCIRALRKEFGQHCLSGFAHDDYSRKHFADCLLPDARLAKKSRYMQLLKDYPICVATSGLHGSSGWKFGEYVAYAKAIVSEPLRYQPPGDFRAGQHYLEFHRPEDCVVQTARLFDNQGLRQCMMLANHQYYQSYLRPDMMILRSLCLALNPERLPVQEKQVLATTGSGQGLMSHSLSG